MLVFFICGVYNLFLIGIICLIWSVNLFVFFIIILCVFFLFKKWNLFNILFVVLKCVFGKVEWLSGLLGCDVIKILCMILLCLNK